MDWENGDSLIIVRTPKGAQLLESAETTGTIRIQQASKEEMLMGQVVNRRRESVKKFSEAYKEMPFAISVPMLESNTTTDYKKELKMLRTFVETDTMNKEAIYAMATNIIKNYERNQNAVNRIWRKINRIVNKIKSIISIR